MRRHGLRVLPEWIAAAVLAAACGSLNKGEVQITDGQGGSDSSGGTTSSGGGGGASSGGTSGGIAGGGASEGGAGGNGEGGDAGASGSGATGGVSSGGGPTTTGGADPGEGGAGGVGGAGGAGGCTTSAECKAAAPICSNGSCVACTTNAECNAANTALPFCQMNTGRCVGCLTDNDCSATTPVCGTNSRCRTCTEGSECGTLACTAKGTCATSTQVVYALAQTGFSTSDCGALDRPCSSLATAGSKLTATRPYLVLLPTQSSFQDGATLPSGLNLTVIGNGVTVAPYTGASGFVVSGGTVSFDRVIVKGTGAATMPPNPGIACTGATLKFHNGTISNFGVLTNQGGTPGLSLIGCNAEVTQSKFLSNGQGISSTCSGTGCVSSNSLLVERSYFEANVTTIYFDGATALIRNNLFIKNGFVNYCRIISLRESGTTGIFAYNTMYGNENGCIYTGLVACGGDTTCGKLSSNVSWGNLQMPTPCGDQVYYSAPALTNSISEATWPGTGNITGDPRFADAAKGDFSLATGSPAVDKGSTVAGIMPTTDYNGNPRPRGAGPDIGAIETR